MKNLLVLISVSFLFWMCGSNDSNTSKDSMDNVKTEEVQEWFGAEFPLNDVIDVRVAVAQLADVDSVPAIIKAKVGDVCQKKGCWMEVEDMDGSVAMFVQFHDYGFFMPMDLGGHEVVMKGYAYREWTSVADLQHYAEDEGQTVEEIAAITEPKEEIKFMATGVKMLN